MIERNDLQFTRPYSKSNNISFAMLWSNEFPSINVSQCIIEIWQTFPTNNLLKKIRKWDDTSDGNATLLLHIFEGKN